MPLLKTIIKQIKDQEGFDVYFTTTQNVTVRKDKSGFTSYNGNWQKMARSDWTVAEWKKSRFNKLYGGYNVVVLDGHGEPVPGNKKLKTLRESYPE